jgi:molecular chaperone DnaK
MATNKIIGIDLGTTNSVVSVMEGSSPKVLINSSGSRLTPSVVGFTDKGERLVGQIAKHQQVTNPENTVFSIKRFMGRRHNEVASEEKIVPYKITGGSEELVKVNIRGKEFTPPEISAMILQDLKKTAEDYLGEKITSAVITVRQLKTQAQSQALRLSA